LPRIGMNPGRGKKTEYTPTRVTVAVLTYVPNEVGYFANRFDVTRACLESILKHTSSPYDLMVFDNGSDQRLVDYLRSKRDRGEIDFLLLSSRNIGKIGALEMIFNAAPGSVIAYSDDDVFFLPGWLEKQIQVLDTYPDVGMVTGMYIKPHMKEGVKSTLAFAEKEGVITRRGNLVDRDLEDHYVRQTGRTWDRYQEEVKGLEDVRMIYKDIETFASAGHYQFTALREVIQKVLPDKWSAMLMGQMRELDVAIDGLGLLRLCTTPPTIRLLGNLIDDQAAAEIKKYGIKITPSPAVVETSDWRKKIYRIPLIRKIAYFLYERLFKIINA